MIGCSNVDAFKAQTCDGSVFFACPLHVSQLPSESLVEVCRYVCHDTGEFSRQARELFDFWHKCLACRQPCGIFSEHCACQAAIAFRRARNIPQPSEE